MKTQRPNPFQYGRELEEVELVDRGDELATIHETIRNRGKLFLIGPRRYGKTSLLAAAAESLDPNDAAVVRINAEAFETLDLFAQELANSAVRALRTNWDRAQEWAQRTLPRLRPKVTLGAGGISIEFGLSDRTNEMPTIVEALNAIEELARGHGRAFVIIIDEVQELILPTGLAAEKLLRSAVQEHRHIGYIFAGSATRLLHAMTHDANRPFYRLGKRLFLGPIPREEFGAFISAEFEKSGFSIGPEAVRSILEHARDVPYNVQRLAHESWELARSGTLRSPIEPAGIEQALARIVQQEGPAHATLWRSLTAAQKGTIKAVIRHGGRNLHSREVSRESRLATSTIQRALEALETRQLIRQELESSQNLYHLVDPFFAAWLWREQRAST